MDVLKLSSDLMSFKSISPKSAGSLEFIQDLLNKWGFDCHLLEFGESKVKNLMHVLLVVKAKCLFCWTY